MGTVSVSVKATQLDDQQKYVLPAISSHIKLFRIEKVEFFRDEGLPVKANVICEGGLSFVLDKQFLYENPEPISPGSWLAKKCHVRTDNVRIISPRDMEFWAQ